MGKDVYRLPKPVYYQCVWIIKDMDRLRMLEAADSQAKEHGEHVFFAEHEEIIKRADVLAHARWKLDCVRRSLEILPHEYRQGTIDSIIYSIPYGDMAHENTWRKWRLRFIRELAKNLMLI